jgi:thioesterase domain-containing protein
VAREAGVPVEAEGPQSPEELTRLLERRTAEVFGQSGSRLVRALARVHVANLRSLEAYQPQPYAGPVHVFRAHDEIEGGLAPAWLQQARQDPGLGWAGLAVGEMQLIEVPGNHLTLVRPPHVMALARALRTSLEAGSSCPGGIESGSVGLVV